MVHAHLAQSAIIIIVFINVKFGQKGNPDEFALIYLLKLFRRLTAESFNVLLGFLHNKVVCIYVPQVGKTLKFHILFVSSHF